MFKRKKRRSKAFEENNQVIDFEDARAKRKKRRGEFTKKRNSGRNSKPEQSERRVVKMARRRLIYSGVAVFILVLIAVSTFNIISLKISEDKLAQQQEELLAQREKLQKEYDQINSPEYVEYQARSQLKMVKPGELLYVFPQEDKKTTGSGILPD